MTGRVMIARTVGTTTLLLALCGKNARRRVGYAVDWGARGGKEAKIELLPSNKDNQICPLGVDEASVSFFFHSNNCRQIF